MSKLVKYEWSPNWFIRYRDSDGCYRKVSTRTSDKGHAETIKARFDAKQHTPPEQEQQTVELLLDTYLDAKKGNVTSWDSLYYPAQALKEHFGKTQPRHITEFQVRQYHKAMKKKGRSNGTTIKHLNTLRMALSWCKQRRWIEDVPYIPFPPKPHPVERWLTTEEVSKLVDACKQPHVKLFIELAVKTGARKSAILQLTWDRVSFDRDLIFYPLPGIEHGKKRRAIVPISKNLKKSLTEARELAQTDWVIEYNGNPLSDLKTAWKTALKASGIDHCRMHDLRHTCATWLIMQGTSFERVARMLGDSVQVIERVYGHHAPDYLKDAAEAIDW